MDNKHRKNAPPHHNVRKTVTLKTIRLKKMIVPSTGDGGVKNSCTMMVGV